MIMHDQSHVAILIMHDSYINIFNCFGAYDHEWLCMIKNTKGSKLIVS